MKKGVTADGQTDSSLPRRFANQAMNDVCGVPVIAIIILLLMFLFLRTGMMPLGQLPGKSYEQSFIAWEAMKSLPGFGLRIIPVLTVIGILGWRWKFLMMRWSQWEHGPAIRCFVIVTAVVLLWPHVTYDYNSFFGQWHAMDRIVLLVSFAGLCWRPIFVLPFVLQVIVIAGQFVHPIGGYSWVVADQAIHLLILFLAYYLFSVVTGERRVVSFFFLAVCFVAAHYWSSGYLKVRAGWLQENHIEYVLPNTYANGWLPGLSPDSIGKGTNLLAQFAPFLKLFILVAECGCVLLFMHRRAALFFLGLFVLFHLGVFIFMGFCFWAWIFVDACLLFLIWKKKMITINQTFGGLGFCLAFLLILTSHKWLKPGNLMWFDAKATYTYRIYGEGVSGKNYHLQPRYFQPYNYQFATGEFGYLSKEKTLPITFGATSKPVANALVNVETAEEVLALESEVGTIMFNAEKRDRLSNFLQKFVAETNESPNRNTLLRMVQPPRLLMTFGEDGAYRYEEPIKRVTVVQVLSFFDGETCQEIRRKPVLDVDIPANSSR